MNGPTSVDWTSALLVLAAGLVAGTVLVWKVLGRGRAGTKPGSAPAADLVRRDLEGKADALIAQLRELEDTGSKRGPEQLARERYALELEAARALLALDAAPSSGAKAAAPAAPSPAASGAKAETGAPDKAGLRGFLWGTLSASAVGLLLFFLYTQARPRASGAPVTGEVPGGAMGSGGAPTAAAPSADEARLQEKIARNPDDLDSRMALARVYLSRQDMMGVWNETKAVLERAPGHAQALAYQALVRLAMGQGDKAVELLQQSLARDPDLIDAYVHLALVYVRTGKPKEAEKIVAEAGRRFPGEAASLKNLLAEMQRGETQADAEAVGEADPHRDVVTPGEDARPPAAAAAASPGGKGISGTIDLDPALKGQVGAGGVLFVFVRESGFGAGPPVAVRRLPATSFPAAFEITEADAMMGQAFPDAVLVEARLDGDGDPTTRPPTDPKARLDDVKTGSKDVRLVLKRAQ